MLQKIQQKIINASSAMQNFVSNILRMTIKFIYSEKATKCCEISTVNFSYVVPVQTMTEAEHNRPNPKLFGNRPSASAAEVFGDMIRPIISTKTFGHISKKSLELCLSPYF